MPNDILILKDYPASTGSLIASLRRSFPDMAVRSIISAELHGGALDNPKAVLLVLPGIIGETSPYPDLIGEEGLRKIHAFASRKVVLTICAATYFVCGETLYDPPWGTSKGRKSANHLFNALARGPVPPYGRRPGVDPKYGDVTVVPVRYKDLQGVWRDAHSCYGNGPALYPADLEDPKTSILAVFSDVAGQPAGLVRRAMGDGALYLSGILPEIGYQSIPAKKGLEDACRVMALLKPHEESRNALWRDLVSRLRADMKLDR